METELADYIFNYCYKFYNDKERKAIAHHLWTVKYTPFKDKEIPSVKQIEKKLKSEDPEVLQLLKDGYPSFIMNTAERIYKDHKNELEQNLCPKCNKIARTPEAKQCRFCGHDWH
jgi:hypothetical protein